MSVPETPELEKLRAACTQGEWFSAIKPNGKGPGVVGIKVERGPGAIAVVNGIPGGPERVANTKIIGLAPQLVDEVLRLRKELARALDNRTLIDDHQVCDEQLAAMTAERDALARQGR